MEAERIRTRRKELGLKQTELALAAGVSVDSIRRWEGATRNPRNIDLKKVADALQTTVAYLTGETNDPTLPTEDTNSPIDWNNFEISSDNLKKAFPESKIREMHLVQRVASRLVSVCCGNGGSPYATDIEWDVTELVPIPDEYVRGYAWQGATFSIMTAEGDSMEPYIKDGQDVLIASYVDVFPGDIIVFSLNSRLYIKGLKKMTDKEFVLTAYNPSVPDKTINFKEEDFYVVGKVLLVISANKLPPVI